jgi:excisionase family DNA binding protein
MVRKQRMQRMHDYGLTLAQIGQIEGISKQRVSRILKGPKHLQPVLFTTGAAAEYLGIHANTLRRWSAAGVIKYLRLANSRRDRRFAKQELDRFLEQPASIKPGLSQ